LSKKEYNFVRCEIYPDDEQKKIINQTLAYKRFVYNRMLADEQKEYEKSGKCIIPPYSTYKPLLADTKGVDNVALNNVWWSVRADLNRFFAKKSGFPVKKRKSDQVQYYKTINNNGCMHIEKQRVKLPKLKWVHFNKPISIPANTSIEFAIISRNNKNQYFVNLAFKSTSTTT